MKLHGKRLLIEKPVKPESQVLLSEESEAAMEQEWMKTGLSLKYLPQVQIVRLYNREI
jgi:hypothetical protein